MPGQPHISHTFSPAINKGRPSTSEGTPLHGPPALTAPTLILLFIFYFLFFLEIKILFVFGNLFSTFFCLIISFGGMFHLPQVNLWMEQME
jgi:hypothetical protein